MQYDFKLIRRRHLCPALIVRVVPTDKQIGSQGSDDTRLVESAIRRRVDNVDVETLKVCTSKGIYRLSQMQLLTFEPKHSSILGIPYEKVHKHNKTIEYLYARNNFTPIFPNNQIYSQGYYSEIQSFITSIEHGHSSILTDIASIKPTHEVLTRIKRLFAESN